MTQPISFTDAPASPDAPDGLPAKCFDCDSSLPDSEWGFEEDFEVREIDGRDREVPIVAWFVICPACKSVNRFVA